MKSLATAIGVSLAATSAFATPTHNGLHLNGFTLNGISWNVITINGVSSNVITINGSEPAPSTTLFGLSLLASQKL